MADETNTAAPQGTGSDAPNQNPASPAGKPASKGNTSFNDPDGNVLNRPGQGTLPFKKAGDNNSRTPARG